MLDRRRRDRQATIAHDHRGDAMTHRFLQSWGDLDFQIIMGMNIDKTRGNPPVARVAHLSGWLGQARGQGGDFHPECPDHNAWRRSQTIEKQPVFDEQIQHGSPFRLGSRGGSCDLRPGESCDEKTQDATNQQGANPHFVQPAA